MGRSRDTSISRDVFMPGVMSLCSPFGLLGFDLLTPPTAPASPWPMDLRAVEKTERE
jgi:hypothetical protein